MKAIHTIIRNKEAPRDDFIFYAERLSSFIVSFQQYSWVPWSDQAFQVERGLCELSYQPKTVITPINESYKGLYRPDDVCGVSIVRAGATMETGLRRVCQAANIGKILIQSDPESNEPKVTGPLSAAKAIN